MAIMAPMTLFDEVDDMFIPTDMTTASAVAQWRDDVAMMQVPAREGAVRDAFKRAHDVWKRHPVNDRPEQKPQRIELYSYAQAGFIALRALADDFHCAPDEGEGLDALLAAKDTINRIIKVKNKHDARPWVTLKKRFEKMFDDKSLSDFLRVAQEGVTYRSGWQHAEDMLAGKITGQPVRPQPKKRAAKEIDPLDQRPRDKNGKALDLDY